MMMTTTMISWELCADDLVVIAETEDDLIRRFNEWKDNMLNRGLRVNMNKTKVLMSVEHHKSLRWSHVVCGRGVGSNSVECTCQKWVHKKCSGIMDSIVQSDEVIYLYKLLESTNQYRSHRCR